MSDKHTFKFYGQHGNWMQLCANDSEAMQIASDAGEGKLTRIDKLLGGVWWTWDVSGEQWVKVPAAGARLLKLRMVGERYCRRSGRRYPGFTHATIEGEPDPRYFTENFSPNEVIEMLSAHGVDCEAYKRGLAHWTKTGQPFDVESGKNCT